MPRRLRYGAAGPAGVISLPRPRGGSSNGVLFLILSDFKDSKMDTKDALTLVVSGSAVAVAAVSAVKALIEYRLQGAAKRSDIFLQMRSRLRSDSGFARICGMLEVDDPGLR